MMIIMVMMMMMNMTMMMTIMMTMTMTMIRERRGELYGWSTWNYRPAYDFMNNMKKKFL